MSPSSADPKPMQVRPACVGSEQGEPPPRGPALSQPSRAVKQPFCRTIQTLAPRREAGPSHPQIGETQRPLHLPPISAGMKVATTPPQSEH